MFPYTTTHRIARFQVWEIPYSLSSIPAISLWSLIHPLLEYSQWVKMYDLIGYLVHSFSHSSNKRSFNTCFESRMILFTTDSEVNNTFPSLKKFTIFGHIQTHQQNITQHSKWYSALTLTKCFSFETSPFSKDSSPYSLDLGQPMRATK